MYKSVLFFLLILFNIKSFAQQHSIDSLQKILLTAKDDTNKVKTLNKLTSIYLQTPTDYKNALLFANQSQLLSQKLSYKKGLAISYNNLGLINGYFGIYEKAFEDYLSELKIWETLKDSDRIVQSYYNISSEYSLQGKFEKSLDIDLMLEKLTQTKKDQHKIVTALWAIETNYSDCCKQAIIKIDSLSANYSYNKAIEYSLKILKIIKDSDGIAYFNNCLGFVYDKCNLCEENKLLLETNLINSNYYYDAEQCYFKSLKIYQKLNELDNTLTCYSNLGLFYRNQGNLSVANNHITDAKTYYQQSLDYYLKAFSIITKLGYKHGIANYSKELGTAYLKLNKLKEAQFYLLHAATGFDEIGYKVGAKDSYKLLSEVCVKEQDYKEAFEYYKTFISFKDSLLNEETQKQLTETEIKYETQKKDNEILLLSKDKQIEESKLRQQSKNILLLIAGTILLIASILIYIKFQQSKTALHLKDLQQKALRAQLNPHFIFNAMQSIQREYAVNAKKGEDMLVEFSTLIREVLDKSFLAESTLEEELDLIRKYISLEAQHSEAVLNLVINVDTAINANNITFPSLALQPIIENAVKYGACANNIIININKTNRLLNVHVENDLPQSSVETMNKERTGTGLKITGERINLFNKKYRVKGGLYSEKKENKFITAIMLAYILNNA